MIAIVDYGAGNLRSVEKAFAHIGAQAVITSDMDTILSASAVVLPGVGAFEDCMESLIARNLPKCLQEVVTRNTPFLGICLGQQLLFESSQEADGEEVQGLGIFKGKVLSLPKNMGLKVPHMGWDSLEIHKESALLKGVSDGAYVYFVHSYYVKATEEDVVIATCTYGHCCDAVVGRGKIFATQFHPEKSGDTGLKILENFADMI